MPYFKDQDYAFLQGGEVLAVHGTFHPYAYVIGEIVFVPGQGGDRLFDGKPYAKSYVRDGKGIPESDRFKIVDPGTTLAHESIFFRNKSIVHLDKVERWARAATISPDGAGQRADVISMLREINSKFAPRHSSLQYSLTGSLRLEASLAKAHDIDIAVRGAQEDIKQFVTSLRSYIAHTPASRVFEHGKWWTIRAQLGSGLFCPFFSAEDVDPYFSRLSREILIDAEVEIEGVVIKELDGTGMPTVLDVRVLGSKSERVPLHLRVLIAHLRSRGDFPEGTVGRFKGPLVKHTFLDGDEHQTLLITDGTSSVPLDHGVTGNNRRPQCERA